MSEFKAKIASNSKAIAKSFNVETDSFECKITGHELISTSLNREKTSSCIQPPNTGDQC